MVDRALLDDTISRISETLDRVPLLKKPVRGTYHIVKKMIRPLFVPLTGNMQKVRRSRAEIAKYHNVHLGKRCFVIGNGPSLRPEDLERLRDEICFGANKIYYIFDKTTWRPTYYCIQDRDMMKRDWREINEQVTMPKFVGIGKDDAFLARIEPAIYVHGIHYDADHFSENPAEYYYEDHTVSFFSIQMAVYMGIKEIYLLGVDHNYSIMGDLNGNPVETKGSKDHFYEKDNHAGGFVIGMTQAYQTAKRYADAHGIRIVNATRGGKLEVFPREDFDCLCERLHLI